MALSRRFGFIQHIAEQYEEERSEEHEILRKLIGKTSLFKYSTPLEFTSEERDLQEVTGYDSEEETIDPKWKVEFQAILRKSKQKTTAIIPQDFGSGYKTTQEYVANETKMRKVNNFSNLDIPVNKFHLVHNNLELQNNADEFKNCNRYEEQYFEKGIKLDFCRVVSENQGAKPEVTKEIKLPEIEQVAHSEDKIENFFFGSKNDIVNQATHCSRDFEKDLSTCPHQHENIEKESKDKFNLTSNIQQYCRKRSKEQHLYYQHDNGRKENMTKKTQASNTKEVKSRKNVIKVVQAVSFPLDELLPLETNQSTSGESYNNERNTGHKCNTTKNNASSNGQTKPYETDFEESVFHGEVYDSPHRNSEPTQDRSITATHEVYQSVLGKGSSNQVSEHLGNKIPVACNNTCRDTALGNFSFIIDALHSGNTCFVEHLQNVISKQIQCNVSPPIERSEDKSKGFALTGQLNCPSQEGYGFYNEMNSDAKGSLKKNLSAFDKDEVFHKRSEHFVSEKGDNLDKQSKELFKLFIQQCSQLVRTEQDKKMLDSLVHLLKKESGTDLGMTGLSPPSVKHTIVEESSPAEFINSADVLVEKDMELFEGRTLLKGFVQPRHIPKTTIVKSGRDKPTDPRPISTLLAKTSSKPLPLPQFVHDLREESVVQRILTLDWDSKRVLFPDEDVYSDVSNRDFEAVHTGIYNPSTDLQTFSNLKNVQTVTENMRAKSHHDTGSISPKLEDMNANLNVSIETPVKDELSKSVHDKDHQTSITVFGKVKVCMDESCTDATDPAVQRTNSPAGIHSNGPKKVFDYGFSKAEGNEESLEGKALLPLLATIEQEQGPLSFGNNEIDTLPASIVDSVDKLGTLLEKTYGSKTFVHQNISESISNFTSKENKEIYSKKHMKDKTSDNALRQSVNQCMTGKKNKSEKHQNKVEQPSLEIKNIPTYVSFLTKKTSRQTFCTHDSNNKILFMLKDAQDNTDKTFKTHLQATSSESKKTRPCVGIVKPMQVIVISDEDENSSFDTENHVESTRAKCTLRSNSITAGQQNASISIGPSISKTLVEIEEDRGYKNNPSKRKCDIIKMYDSTIPIHGDTGDKQRKRKHIRNSSAPDYEEGQLISDSGSELDVKRKKNEKKSEIMKRVPRVKKRHYREHKRHSSSSSVESLDHDDWPEKSEVKQRHKSSRYGSTSETRGSQSTLVTHKTTKESSKDFRKRHYTVHEGQQFSSEKISCIDTNKTKRRHSGDSRVLHKYEQVNVHQSKQTTTQSKSSVYENILSPEYSSLSDEMLSEEYHRLFGKKSAMKPSDDRLIKESVGRKLICTSAPVKVTCSKSLQDDKAFLQQYKQKVERKEVLGLKCEIKMEKTLSIEQELEDRKFLQSCKKRMEEKAKKN